MSWFDLFLQNTGRTSLRVVEQVDPFPAVMSGADGISLSQTEECNGCRLGVDTRTTTSSVTLKREGSAITAEQCDNYKADVDRVANNTFGKSDFVMNLRMGSYARDVSNVGGNRYCEEVSVLDDDPSGSKILDTAVSSFKANIEKLIKGGRIRKVNSGSAFSENTKIKIIPSLPFNMTFAAVGMKGAEATFPVSQMTLYYPSPVRLDSVQADALLSLNDPSDPTAKFIVLIPLKSGDTGKPSSEFFNKIASQTLSLREPSPSDGRYAEPTIQTGADWSLDQLFTLNEATTGATFRNVKNGYYTWIGMPAGDYERYLKRTVQGPDGATVQYYGWRVRSDASTPRYIMLDTPLDISATDLAYLTQAVPQTPPLSAIHPIPINLGAVYHKPTEPPAPSPGSGAGATVCGLGNICEGFGIGDVDPTFVKNCPNAKCDPFLQNAISIANGENVGWFTPNRVFGLVIGFFSLIAMLLAAYLALKLINEDYDLTLQRYSEQLGKIAAIFTHNFLGTRPPSS
jgi:hypothetical protein